MTNRSRSNRRAGSTRPETSRRIPLWQALVLPLASVLVFFLLLEGGLALFGIQPSIKSEDPFVGFASDVPLFVPGGGPGGAHRMVTASNKLNFFNPQSFARQKPPNTFRVFTLGGSTTYGRPYGDQTSFAGWLRELLPAADGSRNWEVINAGGISYASYRVAHLMEELVQYQPDLFIVYTGHNEFLEERTYGEIRDMSPLVRSTVSVLSRTRTWSAMSGALENLGLKPDTEGGKREKLGAEVNTILDKSVGLDRYTRDDPLRENILHHYRISLERMVGLARAAEAEVIFVTPASNLKDFSPFKSEHSPDLDPSAAQRSEEMLKQAQHLISEQNWYGALELLDGIIALDPRHAGARFLRGQALLGQGRIEEAEEAFRLALDEDVCPLRALTPMRAIVREVAREQGAGLVDYVALLENWMQENKGLPIPGDELFLDHVHPTIEGNRLLAVALIEAMAGQGLVAPEEKWGPGAIEKVARRVEGNIDQEMHGQALANLARVLLWAGKPEDAARLARQAQKTGGDFRQVAVDSASILSSIHLRAGQPEKALQLLYSTLEKAPGAIELRLKLGQILLDPPYKQYEKAAGHLLLVCQQMPEYSWAQTVFGAAMARRGRSDIAYASLTEALRLDPHNVVAKENLAWVRPALKGQQPSRILPSVMLDIYPSQAPLRLVQIVQDSSGRPVPHGILVEFHETGGLKRFVDYNRGVPHGIELTWDTDGRLLSRVIYRNGKPVEGA